MDIERDLFNQLVDIITPFMSDSAQRSAIIQSALRNDALRHSIILSGGGRDFTIHLLDGLIKYGEVEYLHALLDELASRLGPSKQQNIEYVRQRLSAITGSTHHIQESSEESHDRLIGQQIDHYLIEKRVGEGAFGIVYKAIDMRYQRDVAFKVLREDLMNLSPKIGKRFDREIRLIEQLNHSNVVKFEGHGQTPDGARYVAMQWLGGGTLRNKMDQYYGPIPLGEIAEMLTQLSPALYTIHKQRIVHRDLKPENIMLDDTGKYYVGDFGIAKPSNNYAELTTQGAFVGTFHYAAPEQIRAHEVDHRADIYSLGIILYELLTDERPFTDPMDRVYTAVPSIKSKDVSPDLDDVIAKATAIDVEERYSNCWELERDFKQAIHSG